MIVKEGKIYFSLREIAPRSPYSADYLRIRILQKKLQGIKVGREWYTTTEWMDAYLVRYSIKNIHDRLGEAAAQLPMRLSNVKFPVAYGLERQFVPLHGKAETAITDQNLNKLFSVQPGSDIKRQLAYRRDFREFLRTLKKDFSLTYIAAPLAAALLFFVLYAGNTWSLRWFDTARGSVARIESLLTKQNNFFRDAMHRNAVAQFHESLRRAALLPQEFSSIFVRTVYTMSHGVGEFSSGAGDSVASLIDSVRGYVSYAIAWLNIPDRIASFFSPELSSPNLFTARSPVLIPPVLVSKNAVTETTRVREVISRSEVVSPANVSAFQKQLDDLNTGLRSTVNKLVSDVAALYEGSETKTSLVRTFAPSLRTNLFSQITVADGLTVSSGDLVTTAGNLSVTGNGSFSGDLSVHGNFGASSISTPSLAVSGSGTTTFAGGLATAGLASTNGLTITGGSLLATGIGASLGSTTLTALSVSNSSTSTFAGNADITGNTRLGSLEILGACKGCGGTPGGSDRQIQFNNAGAFGASSQLMFSPSNFLGIGTGTPGAQLSVQGSSLLIGTTTALGGLLTPSISATGTLGFYTGGFVSPTMLLDAAGHFGIGTTSPGANIAISGEGLFGGALTGSNIVATSSLALKGQAAASGSNCLQIDTTGNITKTGSGCAVGTVTGTGGANMLTYWTSVGNIAATSSPTASIFTATSTTLASTFPVASSTSFSVADRLTVSGVGTSTFSGALTVGANGGLAVTNAAPANTLFVGSGGNVGIGTAGPAIQLQVNGNAPVGGEIIRVIDNTNTNAAAMSFRGNAGNMWIGQESTAGGSIFSGTTANAGIVGTGANTPLQFITNSSVKMTLLGNGNLGIGTTNPGAPLEITTTTAGNRVIFVNGNISNTSSFGIDSRPICTSSAGTDCVAVLAWPSYNFGGGTVTNLLGLDVVAPTVSAGTATNVIGLRLRGVTTGGTSNTDLLIGGTAPSSGTYAIYQSLARNSYFAGNVGIATTTPGVLFSVHGPELINGTSTIIGGLLTPSISATGTLGFYTGGFAAPTALLDASGNFGIGTTSPASLLSVSANTTVPAMSLTQATSTNSGRLISFFSGSSVPQEIGNIRGLNLIIRSSVNDATNLNAPEGLYISGRYAYIAAAGSTRVTIVDIADPVNPIVKGSVSDATNLNTPRALYVSGRYAYVAASFSNALTIVDISNPNSPAVVGTISDATYLLTARAVYVSGRYAYVTASNASRLTVVDILNPAAPRIVGSVALGIGAAEQLAVSGRYAYVSSFGTSVAVVDISNPTNPTVAGTVSNASLDGSEGIYAAGRYVYVASFWTDRLVVLDISNPAVPAVAGSVTDSVMLQGAYLVSVSGRYAYVMARSSNSITVVDVSKPATPFVVGTLSDTTAFNLPKGMFVSGRYAYITANSGNRLTTVELPGLDIPNVLTGSVQTGTLTAFENADIGNDLMVRGGATIGRGGISSNGPVAIQAPYTTTALAHNVSLLSLTQSNNAFIGTGILLDFATSTFGSAGSFSGNFVEFRNASSTNFIVKSDGALGIATDTPGALLSIKGPFLANSTSTIEGAGLITQSLFSTSSLTFYTNTNNTPRMKIDESGNVGIGTAAPVGLLHVKATQSIPFTATGGTITTNGGYTIHTFTTSGTFTPNTSGNVEYLVVAGGGGGGDGDSGTYGGGGGAGGYRTGSGFAVAGGTAYTVTVGNGGAAAPNTNTTAGSDGGNSVFSTITSTGGGGGGSSLGSFKDGRNGGSGGGVAWQGTTAGTGIAGQGFAGSTNSVGGTGGGGGGSSAASTGTAGGAGTVSGISGSNVTYAAGGGSGTNGASTANSGNGGNSEDSTRNGQAGGSGIVIIRYLTNTTTTNTTSVDSLVINSTTGNVGIATTSPGALFSVHGPALINGTSTIIGGILTPSLSATGTLGFYTGGFAAPTALLDASGRFGVATTSPGSLLAVKGPFLANSTSTIEGGGLVTQAIAATGTLGFYTSGNAAPRMVIDAGGNVGIGTIASNRGSMAPVGKLDINPGTVTAVGALASSALQIYNDTNSGTLGQISFGYDVNQTNATAYISYVNTNAAGQGAGDLIFGTRSVTTDTVPTERLRIARTGNIGIATGTPGALFSVNGGMIAATSTLFGLVTPYITATSTLTFTSGLIATPNTDGSFAGGFTFNVATTAFGGFGVATGYYNAPMLFIGATTTNSSNSGNDMDLSRVAVGTTTLAADFGLHDQFTVGGRINSTWRYASCDFPAMPTQTALAGNGSNICGFFSFNRNTAGQLLAGTTSPGFVRMDTTATAGGGIALMGANDFMTASSSAVMEAVIRFPTGGLPYYSNNVPDTNKANAFMNTQIMVGFTSATTTLRFDVLPLDGAYFLSRPGGSSGVASSSAAGAVPDRGTNWNAVTSNHWGGTASGGKLQSASLAIPPQNSWQKLRIELSPSSVRFYLDGKLISEQSTTTPGGQLTPIIAIQNFATSTASAQLFDITQVRIWMDDPPQGASASNAPGDSGPPSPPVYSQDYASGASFGHWYHALDPAFLPPSGTIMTLSGTSSDPTAVERSIERYQKNVVGIVTDTWQTLLGEHTGDISVAFSGRAAVSVSLENGAIHAGDRITTSSVSGIGMRATRPGYIVGRSLQNFDPANGFGRCDAPATASGGISLAIADATTTPNGKDCTGKVVVMIDTGFDMGIGDIVQDAGDSVAGVETAIADLANDAFAKGAELTQLVVQKIVAQIAVVRDFFVKNTTVLPGGDIKLPEGENQITGENILPAGASSVFIANSRVATTTRIFLTPRAAISAQLAVTELRASEGFMVSIAAAQPSDVPFDWMMITSYGTGGTSAASAVLPLTSGGSAATPSASGSPLPSSSPPPSGNTSSPALPAVTASTTDTGATASSSTSTPTTSGTTSTPSAGSGQASAPPPATTDTTASPAPTPATTTTDTTTSSPGPTATAPPPAGP